MSRTGHSAKTSETISQMGTEAEDWGVCDFTVRTETRDLMLPCKCGECRGNGYTYDYYTTEADYTGPRTDMTVYSIDEMWEAAGLPSTKEMGFTGYTRDENGEYEGDTRWNVLKNRDRQLVGSIGFRSLGQWPCRNCANGRRQFNRRTGIYASNSTGYVRKMHYDVMCNVHYAAWPSATDFTSRYHGADCEACNKNNIKTGTYPVLAQRADGTHAGMWVGNACVHKFGFKKFKTTDDQAKSWYNQASNKRGDLIVDLYVRGYATTSAVHTTDDDN